MIIIGIAGPAGVGKDTLADILVECHGYKKRAFADPLKDMLRAGFGMTEEELTTGKELRFRNSVATVREMMQTLGTEWAQKVLGQHVWVDVMDTYIKTNSPELLVIPDVRFMHEARWLRRRGACIVHMRGRGGIGKSHVSEQGIVPKLWERFVDNSLEGEHHLHREAIAILDEIDERGPIYEH